MLSNRKPEADAEGWGAAVSATEAVAVLPCLSGKGRTDRTDLGGTDRTTSSCATGVMLACNTPHVLVLESGDCRLLEMMGLPDSA